METSQMIWSASNRALAHVGGEVKQQDSRVVHFGAGSAVHHDA